MPWRSWPSKRGHQSVLFDEDPKQKDLAGLFAGEVLLLNLDDETYGVWAISCPQESSHLINSAKIHDPSL